jgi:hypothetical protein
MATIPRMDHTKITTADEVFSLPVPSHIEAKIKTHSKWEGPGTASLPWAGGGFETYCTVCKEPRMIHWHFRGQMGLCSTCHYPHPHSRRECWGCGEEFFAFEVAKRNPRNLYCNECEPT